MLKKIRMRKAESDEDQEMRFNASVINAEEILPHSNPHPQLKLKERKKLLTPK